ncbi:TPA: hypothetical protein ACH3X2_009671 [Trebouxia sp. C0005]
MATRQARRDANKEGKLYSVKTGFNTIFTHPGLAATTLQAVQLVSPILIASNVLANLHVLRCLETTAGDVPKLDQTFFSNCMYAVTHATGHKAVQFDRAKNGELTKSLDIYLQQLPQGHQPLERPTLIKDVSPARSGLIAALAMANLSTLLSSICCCYRSITQINICITLSILHCAVQILNAASLMARTNFKNHIVTNYFSRTLSWIRLQLGQQAFFANMDSRIASSWAKFVCRAAADNITNIWDLLPRYTSLAQPPQHIMDDLENLVATMQQLMGPLPVTEWSLQRRPESYLPWLQLVLKDFEEAQDTPDAPKLFSMLPQSNNNTKFITISSTSLQKLLLATGIANVPSLTAKAGAKQFTQHQESWWNQYTDCISFSKRAQQSRRRFKFQVQTDGISVSVLMFQPFPSTQTDTATAATAAPPPPPGRKRKRQQRSSRAAVGAWVQGLPNRHLVQPARIGGLDPGRKALFTAVVHSQQAADSLQGERPAQHRYNSLSWSCSRWQEAAGIKYRLHKTELWISRKAELHAALLATPTAKVASSAQFLHHIRHRMQHTAAAQIHFGDRRHRQLRWRSFIKRQQAYSAICKEISGGRKDTVVAYGDAKFSSSCCKGNPSTPTVSLRRKVGHCCQVYDTDEFRTSKLCCSCKTAMDGMPLPLLGNTHLC